jgi:hypothetical protein
MRQHVPKAPYRNIHPVLPALQVRKHRGYGTTEVSIFLCIICLDSDVIRFRSCRLALTVLALLVVTIAHYSYFKLKRARPAPQREAAMSAFSIGSTCEDICRTCGSKPEFKQLYDGFPLVVEKSPALPPRFLLESTSPANEVFYVVSDTCDTFTGDSLRDPPALWAYLAAHAEGSQPTDGIRVHQLCAAPTKPNSNRKESVAIACSCTCCVAAVIPMFWVHRTNTYCFCDQSLREKAWRSCKRVAQAT